MEKLKNKLKKKIIIIGICLMTPLFLSLMLLMMVIALSSSGSAAIVPGLEDEQINDFRKVASLCGLDLEEFIAYLTIKYENEFEDLEKVDIEEEALDFMIVKYKEYAKDAEGNWYVKRRGTKSNKNKILHFVKDSLNYSGPTEGSKVVAFLNRKNKSKYWNFKIISKDMRDVAHELTDDEREWYSALISENVIKELVGTYYELPQEIIVETSGFFAWPTPGITRITSPYGKREDPVYGGSQFHKGIDIAQAGCLGKPVIASADGIVRTTSFKTTGYGYSITIEHTDKDGVKWHTKYAHLAQIEIEEGEKVDRGTVIGAIGSTGKSTGPHLHFEILYKGNTTDPMLLFSD